MPIIKLSSVCKPAGSEKRYVIQCIMGSFPALQRDGSGSPDPALTLSFIEKESFKLNLK